MKKINKMGFEQEFAKALRSFGYGFPETQDEVERVEAEMGKMEIPVLPVLGNPSEILTQGEITGIGNMHNIKVDYLTVQNLAMAAREGKSVSDATRRKMLEDRKQSEENKVD